MFGSAAVYIIPGTVKGLPRRCAAPRDETTRELTMLFYLKIYRTIAARRARSVIARGRHLYSTIGC